MPTLRIVSINDVYTLENFPRFRNLVRHHASASGADAFLVILAGDFLAPSLLSSIDAGRGMVDCINAVGVTHVILGNHEDDIPHEALLLRLEELVPVCLGTNVQSGLALPRHAIVDVAPGLRVGLVGGVMADPTIYRGRPFGAELVDANVSMLEETKTLLALGCRSVIPITHQWIRDDRALAVAQREPPFPVIVGGHEHTPALVLEAGTWIVKAGAEAQHAAITEITWSSVDASPTVTTRLDDVASYPEDAEVRARVTMHLEAIQEIANATLFTIPSAAPLSSKGTRRQQTSVGSLICSRLRDALGAEACVFNGGGIRAGRDYVERFTYGDVEAEVPFDNEVVVVPLSGRVIRDAVAASRAVESGAFLQVDDRMVVDDANGVLAIDGAPIELDRNYRVALIREMLLGLDHVEPLVRWGTEHPTLVPPLGCGREPKLLLVQAFARAIWEELGGFDAIDSDRDDRVTPAEIFDAYRHAHPEQVPSLVLADLVMRAVDVDGDRVISRADAESSLGRRPGST